jgi:hypothetical protein
MKIPKSILNLFNGGSYTVLVPIILTILMAMAELLNCPVHGFSAPKINDIFVKETTPRKFRLSGSFN